LALRLVCNISPASHQILEQ